MITIPQTLRKQLSVWYFGSIGVTLLLLVIVISVLLRQTLKNQIDHHIHLVVTEAQRIVERNEGAEERKRLENLVSGQGMTVVLLSPDGSPVLQTNSPNVAAMSEHQMQQLLLQQPTQDGQPLHFTVNNIRFATALVPTISGNNILAVGYSTQVIEETVTSLLTVVGLVVLVTVVPLGVVGYVLLVRFTKPLETMATTAQNISDSRDLSVRMAIQQSTAELQSLAASFNQMLSRLESVFQYEHQFFSDAAHTIKTPLAILRLQAEKERILRQIDQLSVLTQDLLFISRLETQDELPVVEGSFSDLLQEAVEMVEVLAVEKQISVSKKITDNLVVTGQRGLLSRAVANVLQNAINYTPQHGTISIRLRRHKNKLVCTVTDTGIGIAPTELESVFSRFYRGKNTKDSRGSGLGLAITQLIVTQHGGTIKINSKLEKGTEVTITLPLI